MGKRGRKPVYREITCPSCGSNHVVKKGRVRGKQEYLCRNCNRQFLEGTKHRYDESVREKALEMYSNGMSIRAISRVLNVPLAVIPKFNS